jgi:predicted kinase
MMELVIFIGIQASGKSSFYRERFFDSHVRINLDMLRTRHRERILFEACLEAKQSMVIDNTNPTADQRARYILAARAAGFHVSGYYFQSRIEECRQRNLQRSGKQAVPVQGLLGTLRKLELPTLEEGFHDLHYVKIGRDGAFVVKEWSNTV